MKRILFFMIVACMVACTDYQSEWKDKWISVNEPTETDGVTVYDTKDDLPVCSAKRGGELAKLKEGNIYAVCHKKKWIYDIEIYSTFDDAPVCSARREDMQIFVVEDAILYTCTSNEEDKLVWVEQE